MEWDASAGPPATSKFDGGWKNPPGFEDVNAGIASWILKQLNRPCRNTICLSYNYVKHMLGVGTEAPDFTLPGTTGELDFQKFSLSDHTQSGAAILLFYPFDFSPICTTELCAFRDAEWLTMTPDVDVLAISRDSCYAHANFIESNDLPFPLLSDLSGDVIEEYRVKYDELEGHKGAPKRALFIINTENTIQYAWETEDAYVNPELWEVAEELLSLSAVEMDEDF